MAKLNFKKASSSKHEKKVAKPKEISKNKGKTSGLNVRGFFALLLKENRSHKKTDDALLQKLHAEFPEKKTSTFSLIGIRVARNIYNRTGFTSPPRKPEHLSTPYDKHGKVIEVKRGRKPNPTKDRTSKAKK